MEPTLIARKGQESFTSQKNSAVGIFMFLGIVIFFVSVASLVGLIFYRQFLETKIEEMSVELKKQEEDFRQSSIEEWSRTAESINIAKEVLGNHTYLTNAFKYISQNTLPDVRFSKFNFDSAQNMVTLSMQARSFTALAQQKDIFEKDPAVSTLGITRYTLTPTGGVDAEVQIIFNEVVFKKQ